MQESQPAKKIAEDTAPEVIRVATKILTIEKEHLFERRSQGVVDEILKVIKEEIK